MYIISASIQEKEIIILISTYSVREPKFLHLSGLVSEQRVCKMEHAPLVMSLAAIYWRCGQSCHYIATLYTFFKRLANMISNTDYSQTVNLISCKLSFALLRALIM